MNKLVRPDLLILLMIMFSCTDRGFTKFKQSIYFNNQSGQNLNIYFYKDQDIDTIQINNFENYHFGIYNYDSPTPIDLGDSIFIQFDDSKILKYFPSINCTEKNIFCNTTYYCISGDTTICQFLIDEAEYLKAK